MSVCWGSLGSSLKNLLTWKSLIIWNWEISQLISHKWEIFICSSTVAKILNWAIFVWTAAKTNLTDFIISRKLWIRLTKISKTDKSLFYRSVESCTWNIVQGLRHLMSWRWVLKIRHSDSIRRAKWSANGLISFQVKDIS